MQNEERRYSTHTHTHTNAHTIDGVYLNLMLVCLVWLMPAKLT